MIRRTNRNKILSIALSVKNNPKKFLAYVNSKRKCSQGIPNLIVGRRANNSGVMTKNDEQKAEALADYFSSVYIDENCENVTPNFELDFVEYKSMRELLVSENNIKKIISMINVNKSPGPDGIHPRVIKEVSS